MSIRLHIAMRAFKAPVIIALIRASRTAFTPVGTGALASQLRTTRGYCRCDDITYFRTSMHTTTVAAAGHIIDQRMCAQMRNPCVQMRNVRELWYKTHSTHTVKSQGSAHKCV